VTAPRFAVLLSAYNEERLVGEAISSVLAQTLPQLELIVIDDGSADRTAEVVSRFDDPRVRLIRQENRGLAPSLNRAAEESTAPRLALIDADDLWFPDFLLRLDAALDATPDAGFAYTDSWWLHEATGRFYRESISEYLGAPKVPPSDPEEMLISLLPANWIFGLTAMERAAFDAVGGFDASLSACEDYELWLRFLAHGYRGTRAPGRLAVQRERAGSMSRNYGSMLRNLEGVYRVVAEQLPVGEEAKRMARQRLETIDRHATAAQDDRATPLTMWWAARHRVGNLRKRLAPWLIWHRGVPTPVREAFPGLDLSRPTPPLAD
jgi:glycosyltransferase involved in cell wall biosynthesis